ncbi:hypothetical protein [Kineococcus aurantiacus]|uniref:Uncharacterized protein n=1 Tax=Kineococcus aurantiacus TaxID=37633 RepID=A0A7Y9ASG3_9ACTN|nr:hypothetical protein [Kineococcus aurantiacus]NYD20914.1 hypothetical protein [Kineococcus aurantiacus]
MDTTPALDTAPAPDPAPATDYRRRALHQLTAPGDDDGEYVSHLVSRYLSHLDEGARSPLQAPDLLTSLTGLFAALADQRHLRPDDPAVRTLARVLLQGDRTPAA